MKKNCINCKHFHFQSGEAGYCREETEFPRIFCIEKGHWEIDIFYTHTADFRKKMQTAETCKDFTPYNEENNEKD